MMKKIPLISALLVCIAAGLFVKLRSSASAVDTNTIGASTIKKGETIPEALVQDRASNAPTPSAIDLEQKIESIRALTKKALHSKDEAKALTLLLSDKDLQDKLFETLSSGDHLPFNIANERDRMEMVGLLNMMVMQKNMEGRQAIINRAIERVTSVDFKAMKDLKQKQSIFGDVVEIMKLLKRLEPDAYATVRSALAGSQEKAMQHALYVAG